MAILFIIIFMDLVGFGLLIPLLPFYVQRVGAGPEVITLVLGLYSVGQFLAAPVWGRISDSFGRKPVLALTSFGLAASYIMLAYANDLTWLVVARLFGGIMAGNIAAAQAYISDTTTRETRARGMGLLGAAFGLGFIVGPGIGGLLGGHDVATADFVTPALVAAAVTLVAALGVVLLLKESLAPHVRAARRTQPRLAMTEKVRTTFARKPLVVLVIVSFVTITAWALFETVFALWANAILVYGPFSIGTVLTVMGLVAVVIQGGAIGPLSRRVGEKRLAIAALILLMFGYGALSLAHSPPSMWAAVLLLGVGSALFTPSLSSLVSQEAGEHEQGAVLGVYQGATALSRIVGPSVSGLIFARLGTGAPFLLAGLLVLPGLVLLITRRD